MSDTGFMFTDLTTVIITVFVGVTVLALVYIANISNSPQEDKEVSNKSHEVPRKKKNAESTSSVQKSGKKKHNEKWSGHESNKQKFAHSWLLTSLKGHSGKVLDMDFSSNGKFLATCAEDRSILLWSTKDWDQNEHKCLRVNVEFDHATFVKWSPDSKAFIIHKARENVGEVYKVNKKQDGWISGVSKAITYPKHHGEDTVVGMGIACNGKFIMSCSEKTDLVLFNLKGQLLAKIDTLLMSTFSAHVTPCGRYVVACGFTSDVKVWEVIFNKNSEFQQASKVYELTGHTAGVYDTGFSTDSSRMATVSKDGTWKIYNTQVEYKNGEDPHLLVTGKYNQKHSPSHLAMSPNGEVVAIANGNTLSLFSALTGECDQSIEGIYSGNITRVQFDSLGKYVLTAGERHVRVFHNVTGYRTTIASQSAKLRQAQSASQKERMKKQIDEAENFLRSIGETRNPKQS